MGSINDASWEIDMITGGRGKSPVVLLDRFMRVCWRAKDAALGHDSLGSHVSNVSYFNTLKCFGN